MAEPKPTSPQVTPTETTDLYCPQCEYNLHGIDSLRCPECGTAIDYEALAKVCTLERQSLREVFVPQAKNYWQVYWGLCAIAWFHPRILAEKMPYRHFASEAHFFNLINKFVASLMVMVAAFVMGATTMDSNTRKGILAFLTLVLVCSYACEVSIAFTLRMLVKPRGRPDAPKYHFWRGLQHVMSCHLMVSAAFGAVGSILIYILGDLLDVFGINYSYYGFAYYAVSLQFFAGPFLYWWILVNRTISVRGAGLGGLAMATIPIVVFLVITGIYLSAIFLFLAYS